MEARKDIRNSFSIPSNQHRDCQPEDGFSGLKANWKDDFLSGLLVSLIALPLCLGIAMASGFPAFGGIITAIVGGLLVGPLCGSLLSIKGPAAGLIAIAIACVEALGEGDMAAGYRYTLAVIVIAGLVQVLFASLKLGKYSDFFPSSAVHGMLAAIGVIIFAKQIHPMLGVKPVSKDPIDLIVEIPTSLANMNPEVALIGFTSVLILLIGPKLLGKYARILPAQLLAVLVCVPLGIYFDLSHEHIYTWHSHSYNLSDKELVNLPSNFFEGITFPDFSKILTLTSFQYIVMFALIGSLESLLTVKAVDGLDPYKRKADSNKDLFYTGIGNTICGFLGGLPMISEVVRSYANIDNGAKTRWANVFHGICLLVFVVFLPNLIHRIPIASLSAILCVTGYRLAAPKHFKHAKEIGLDQLVVFSVTVIGTLKTDLLIGVALGIATEYLLCTFLSPKSKNLLKNEIKVKKYDENSVCVRFPSVCYFGNILKFNKILDEHQEKDLIFDFSNSLLVDHTFVRRLSEAKDDCALKGRELSIKDLDKLSPLTEHEHSLRRRKLNIHDRVTTNKAERSIIR